MARPIKIACVGEAMVELSLSADGTRADLAFAGDVLNTAIYLKRSIGAEGDVAFVSALGEDTFSDRMVEFIGEEGIGTALLQRRAEKLPGLYAITLDESGERSFSYWRENSAARSMFDQPDEVFEALSAFDVIYCSGITLAILPEDARTAFIRFLEDFAGTVAFDSNYRARLWPDRRTALAAVEWMWSIADIALPSIDDEMELFAEADAAATRRRIAAYDFAAGALKRGAQGPLSVDGSPVRLHFEEAENVVDTTAAGDSFNGGFLASWLTRGDLETALAMGHECAVRVVGHRGAIVPLEEWQSP